MKRHPVIIETIIGILDMLLWAEITLAHDNLIMELSLSGDRTLLDS